MAVAKPIHITNNHPALQDVVMQHVLLVCDPNSGLVNGLTLRGANEDSLERVVASWRERDWLPAYLPSMRKTLLFFAKGQIREIRDLARGLDSTLAEPQRAWSLEAGAEMVGQLRGIQGDRGLTRFLRLVDEGLPTHFCVIFAVRAALFRLPHYQVLVAAVYHEILQVLRTMKMDGPVSIDFIPFLEAIGAEMRHETLPAFREVI